MALVSICVLPNHATFMTDTLDATFVPNHATFMTDTLDATFVASS